MRESPALKVLELLEDYHANVKVVDAYIFEFKWKDGYYKTVPLTKELLNQSDAVVITTAHKKFVDYSMVCRESRLIFDTKNVLKDYPESREKIHVL